MHPLLQCVTLNLGCLQLVSHCILGSVELTYLLASIVDGLLDQSLVPLQYIDVSRRLTQLVLLLLEEAS